MSILKGRVEGYSCTFQFGQPSKKVFEDCIYAMKNTLSKQVCGWLIDETLQEDNQYIIKAKRRARLGFTDLINVKITPSCDSASSNLFFESTTEIPNA